MTHYYFDYFTVGEDACDIECAACAMVSAQEELRKIVDGREPAADAARRLLALIRLEQPDNVDEMSRAIGNRLRYRWHRWTGDNRAKDLWYETVRGWSDNGGSYWGEYCGSCHEQVVEPSWECECCGWADIESSFPFPETIDMGDHDPGCGEGPTVPVCGRCEDETEEERAERRDRQTYRHPQYS